MKKLAIFCLPILSIWLSGCVSLVGATTSEPIEMDPNRRTMGTMIDDSQLETIAAVNINKAHPALKSAPITVTSFNQVILLTGQVKNAELRELAGRTVAKLSNVRQVHNELTIQAPTSFLANTNDAWLTSKVKTKLAANKQVRATRVKVLTENGVVYLMGMIPRAEAEKAAEIASGTSGVQKVVLAVEYMDRR
ncbi:BON domain-containing protein [Proteobacteria bacterium 005FR1]|nr:BON domain-containing protein [Proteobacteria bacterium 005FR1]